MIRKCGDCQLCCKLLPVRELAKPGNTRCQHQRHGKGCAVYNRPPMPGSCQLWNCRWLLSDDTAELRRPDRVGYVIDVMPDFVTMRNELTGAEPKIAVVQIWVDPARPDAWKDDADLFRYVERRATQDRMAALMRNGEVKATAVFAPCLSDDGEWHIVGSGISGPAHTPEDVARAGFKMQIKVRS